MQFSIKFSFNFKRSAPPASRQTDSTDSMHSDILARSAKINISAVGTTLPILARRATIFSAQRGPIVVQVVSELCQLFDNSRTIHGNLCKKTPKSIVFNIRKA